MPAGAAGSGDGVVETKESFLHVAYHILSPWRSTLSCLVRGAVPPGEPPETERRIYLQVGVDLADGQGQNQLGLWDVSFNIYVLVYIVTK